VVEMGIPGEPVEESRRDTGPLQEEVEHGTYDDDAPLSDAEESDYGEALQEGEEDNVGAGEEDNVGHQSVQDGGHLEEPDGRRNVEGSMLEKPADAASSADRVSAPPRQAVLHAEEEEAEEAEELEVERVADQPAEMDIRLDLGSELQAHDLRHELALDIAQVLIALSALPALCGL